MSSLKVNQIRAKLGSMFESHLDLSDIGATEAGCTEQEAAAAVWDGGDDNGIDAAHFDTSASRVIFVQSKWIGS